MRCPLFAAVLLAVALPAAADNSAAAAELRHLQGTWTAVSMESDGKAAPEPQSTVIITEDKWIERSPGGDSIVTLAVNPATDPKQIDQVTGAITLHGIYKLEGDTLTVSIPVPFGGGRLSRQRAAAFVTKPGDPFAVFVYKRAGEAALERLTWESDWAKAFRTAKDQHQLVFVDYFATWCVPCKEMDATVFRLPDVKKRLDDFVLLRVDADRGNTAWSHHVGAYPTYVIYDPDERERFRILGARPPTPFRNALDDVRNNAPALLRVSDLLDDKRTLEAQILLGNTYGHLGMTEEARAAYQEARTIAEQNGQKASAQKAEALSAFTLARDGNPKRAIKLLEKLAANPVDRDTAALIWLSIGNARRLSNDTAAALEAYQHALSSTEPGSAMHREVTAAIESLH